MASLVAHPASLAFFSFSCTRRQVSSCAPFRPRIFPLRAAITVETRALSCAILPTGSSSFRSSFAHTMPAFVTARYDLASTLWARLPTYVISTCASGFESPSARCVCNHLASRCRADGNSLLSIRTGSPTTSPAGRLAEYSHCLSHITQGVIGRFL